MTVATHPPTRSDAAQDLRDLRHEGYRLRSTSMLYTANGTARIWRMHAGRDVVYVKLQLTGAPAS